MNFKKVFTLDLRSLALMRIAAASILILDLINRSRSISAHYTDWGSVPRDMAVHSYDVDFYTSLHFSTGTAWGQAILFLIAGVFAFFLLIGHRTRLSVIVSWAMLLSLQNRNYFVLNSGDVLIRLLLFWGIFLPLGARYSLDAALQKEEEELPNSYFSIATVGLILQVMSVYVYAGWLKLPEPSWQAGLGTYYALNDEQFTTAFGRYMGTKYELLKAVTPIVLYFEVWWPFVILIPFRNSLFRIIGVLMGFGFHIANQMMLEFGFFSFIGMTAWSALFPSEFWDYYDHKRKKKTSRSLQIFYDGDCSICLKIVRILKVFLNLKDAKIKTAQSQPAIYAELLKQNSWIVIDSDGTQHTHFDGICTVFGASTLGRPLSWIFRWSPIFKMGDCAYRWFADHRLSAASILPDWHSNSLLYGTSKKSKFLAGFFVLYVTYWNFTTVPGLVPKMPRYLESFGYLTRLSQDWIMFSKPITESGWFVVAANQRDGKKIDLFNGGQPLTFDKPAVVSKQYPDDRWRKYIINIYQENKNEYWLNYARYLCRSWNDFHEPQEQVETFKIIFMKEVILPEGGKLPPEQQVMWSHDCFH